MWTAKPVAQEFNKGVHQSKMQVTKVLVTMGEKLKQVLYNCFDLFSNELVFAASFGARSVTSLQV